MAYGTATGIEQGVKNSAMFVVGGAGAFTAGAYYMQAAAASRNTAKVAVNENVEVTAVESLEAAIEESTDLGNKLDYMLGKATGNKHNI